MRTGETLEPTGRLELPTARLQVECAASCATPALPLLRQSTMVASKVDN
jgi:hypothetical protein